MIHKTTRRRIENNLCSITTMDERLRTQNMTQEKAQVPGALYLLRKPTELSPGQLHSHRISLVNSGEKKKFRKK